MATTILSLLPTVPKVRTSAVVAGLPARNGIVSDIPGNRQAVVAMDRPQPDGIAPTVMRRM